MKETWLVTGSSVGLGRSIVEAALAEGRNVVATARHPRTLDDLWQGEAPCPHVGAASRCAASFLSHSGRLVSRRRHHKEYSAMTDYVLIHGAWHGSWCWTRVRRLLAAGAHRVFTPTLTGVGERSHLLSRDVGLDTHVADVANLMIWEDLRDIVLVRTLLRWYRRAPRRRPDAGPD
jgi:NAD(P)-dependent dehydrogenase (short-subunit alcohol dehydrogenase family)